VARNIREQPIRIDLVVGELGNVSMALPLLEEIEICRTNTGITTNYHVVDPRGGVRGVIPSKQGY
jgi:hypothetical protein